MTGNALDETAVAMACDMVRKSRGTVWVLYVIEVPLSVPLDAELASEAARGERVLQNMERVGRSMKCTVEGEILQARSLGPAVIDEATQRGADMIVLGVPFQVDYGVPTLGDVVPYLLKYSPTPVLVYREEASRARIGN